MDKNHSVGSPQVWAENKASQIGATQYSDKQSDLQADSEGSVS